MSNVFIDSTYMTGIANAIRQKNGTQDTYLPSEMPSAINNIPSGNIVPNYPLNNGKNNIWILVTETPCTISVYGTITNTVDWGDGTKNTNTSHTYSDTGMYCIQSTDIEGVDYTKIINAEYNTGSNYRIDAKDYLEKIKFNSSSITSIKLNSFYMYRHLKEVNFANITTIGNYAFQYCPNLTSIDLTGITSIGESAFRGNNNSGGGYLPMGLTSVTIPGTVTTIGQYAFAENNNLISATINEGVTQLPSYLFSRCKGLTTVSLPSTLTTIQNNVFHSCIVLTTLTIPANVTSIGNQAFYFGSSEAIIRTYHFLSTTPPTLGTNVFNNIKAGTIIYVPAESVETYKTATGWSNYASYIQAEPSN